MSQQNNNEINISQSDLTEINKIIFENIEFKQLLEFESVFQLLKHYFKNRKTFYIYLLSDGNNSTRDISKIIGLSNTTIFNLWKQWESDNIMYKVGTHYIKSSLFNVLIEKSNLEEGNNGEDK